VNIVIAGASGYVGRAIIPRILEKFPTAQITALSRSQQDSADSRVRWVACDLFSLRSIEAAIPKPVDLAFYLVHSMGPTAQLDQGSFADYVLILAEFFSRDMARTQVQHVIYLSGLLPDYTELSLHLQSRLEVEETFANYKLPITIFRAGLSLGEDGSSFQILLKLVSRLPVMICPAWTQTLTTPVDLSTVLSALTEASMHPEHMNKIYDLAGCQPLTYREMMSETARRLNLRRYFIVVPFFTPTLSSLWVTLITNTSKDLVYPLVESLEHKMVARESHQFSSDWQKRSYFDLLEKASMKSQAGASLFLFRIRRKTVRSVQRLHLPTNKNAEYIKNQYLSWLPQFLAPFIIVKSQNTEVQLCLFHRKIVMLELSLSPERSTPDRQLLYIKRGLLVAKNNKGRLEFRSVLNNRFVLAAIHEFRTALPWFIYKYTQALTHLFVMKSFGRMLKNQK